MAEEPEHKPGQLRVQMLEDHVSFVYKDKDGRDITMTWEKNLALSIANNILVAYGQSNQPFQFAMGGGAKA